MNKHFGWTCFLLVGLWDETYAQKHTTHVQQTWFGYVNQAKISRHWSTWLDLHLRTKEDFVTDLSTSIVRAGLTYEANERLKFTAGYAYVNFFPADDHPGVSQPEHRPWQQILWNSAAKRSRVINYIRLEERYRRKIKDADELADGYHFNFRARYSTMLLLPLGEKPFAAKSLSLNLNNEIHINFGKQIVYNYFDQNRFLAGFAYHTTATSYLQFGYMNLFQQLAAGNKYRMTHAARVYYYHNVDLRKK
ncbi:MAG: DUF2490 domain-containing protein [Chitinophagaceae bacterium]|nr:DUF2490 domain-containing protein [Chitinophagaceae bacterium]